MAPSRASDWSDSSQTASAADQRVVDGVSVAPGIVSGTSVLYAPGAPSVSEASIAPEDVADELEALDHAVERAERELTQVIAVANEKLGSESAGIFEAQRLMVRDDALLTPVRQRIQEHRDNAAYAVTEVMDTHRRRLEASDSAFFRERASDLIDVQRRLLQSLRRDKLARTVPEDAILLAHTLTASDILQFSRKGIVGCATSDGGATSHVSIIARALELPTLVGLGDALNDVPSGTPVILDGLSGRLVVDPTPDTEEAYRERRDRYAGLVQEQASTASLPSETLDGHAVTLQANIEFREELSLLERYGAEGIGLFRTEMLALLHSDQFRADRMLSEDAQYALYRDAAEHSAPEGATIRLLDFGGDKVMPLAHREENPFLGWRGIRVLLDRPEILRPQIRALLRANVHGPLRLLLPMVTRLDEIEHVRTVIREESEALDAKDTPYDADLPVGIMVEVPSTALQASHFAKAADFFSIGTNDLTQYTLAVDRGNDLVARHFDSFHPAVLSLIRQTVEAAHTARIPVSLCGAMASDTQAVPVLLALGLTRLSMPPPYVPAVKHLVRNLKKADTTSLTAAIQSAPDADAVRDHVRRWMDAHLDIEWAVDGASGALSLSGDGALGTATDTSSSYVLSPTSSTSMSDSITDRVTDDLKAAMKARDKVRLRTLRSLRTALKNKEISKRDDGQETTLSDQEQLAVVRKQVKQRKDSIEQYEDADRDDLATKEKEEVEVLEDYLPAAMPDDELREVLESIVDDVGASSMADMGPVMGRAMGQLRGRVDGSRVQKMVRDLLTAD